MSMNKYVSVMSTQLVGNLSIHGQVDSFDMFIAHRQWEKRQEHVKLYSFPWISFSQVKFLS